MNQEKFKENFTDFFVNELHVFEWDHHLHHDVLLDDVDDDDDWMMED